jgi:hypothetical protein
MRVCQCGQRWWNETMGEGTVLEIVMGEAHMRKRDSPGTAGFAEGRWYEWGRNLVGERVQRRCESVWARGISADRVQEGRNGDL